MLLHTYFTLHAYFTHAQLFCSLFAYFSPLLGCRLGKLACPRVNDDQKIDVDDKKLNSGHPHDNQLISGYSLIHLG